MSDCFVFSRNEKIRQICNERCGGDLGKLMILLNNVERDWFDDFNLVEDFLSSQNVYSPPRLPSRRSRCVQERYISNWAHYQKKTRDSETEFMEVEKFRSAWDRLVNAFPYAFDW
jgi:hypothetical protein